MNRFLLKYTARDAVDVLTKGTGGAQEARAAVAQYEDKSPLYGLLLYRRRKVLVKYVPEGTSRLLQGIYALQLDWHIRAALTPTCSPRSRPLHHRVREVHAARYRPLYQHPRGA